MLLFAYGRQQGNTRPEVHENSVHYLMIEKKLN